MPSRHQFGLGLKKPEDGAGRNWRFTVRGLVGRTLKADGFFRASKRGVVHLAYGKGSVGSEILGCRGSGMFQ